MEGMCSFIQDRTRLFSMVGEMLDLYTFSIMSGTAHMMVGRTCFIAFMRMEGVGGFWI